MPSIVLNDTRYNYRVDVDHGCLWLEDDLTKRQWQWLSDELQKPQAALDRRRLPDAVVLRQVQIALDCVEPFRAAVQDLFGKSPRSLVQLGTADDGESLRLVVAVPLALVDWDATDTLVLEPLPLQEIDLVRARLSDVQSKYEKLELNTVTKLTFYMVLLGLLMGAFLLRLC